MIEISHQQAQRLIREQQDRPLPDEQWAMLQAHLESCPTCRAYQQRLGTYDRDLRRSLRARWSGARGPGEGIAEWLLRRKANRRRLRRLAGRAALGLLALLLLVGYITYRDLTAPPPLPPMPTPTSFLAGADTPTPVPQTLFRGLVAFGSRRDGNGEIYLMTFSPNGVELNNLTQNPAEDNSPAWSPDGEWLAFLSDRGGKTEIYVETVAGSRLTQVSNAPDIEWQGPLTWSADGKWIGLRGRRSGMGDATWLYLVPLDGSAPRSLGLSVNAPGELRFSSALPMVAYISPNTPGSLLAVNTQTGWFAEMSYEDNAQGLRALDGAFDWSLGGHSLVYVASGPYEPGSAEQIAQDARSEIRISQEITNQASGTLLATGSKVLDTLPGPGAFRAVSWVPNSLLVAALHQGADHSDCWTLWLRNSNNSNQPPRDLTGLCVAGGLARSNWTSDGAWVALIARQPGEKDLGIYALRLPPDFNRVDTTQPAEQVYFERLAGLESEPAAGEDGQAPTWAEPQVRPAGRSLKLSPRAAQPPSPQPVSVFPAGREPGWVVYSVGRGPGQQIARIRPDGSGRMALTGNPYSNVCPRISPDRTSVAFLSNRGPSMNSGGYEVYRMDIDGKNTVKLSDNSLELSGPSGDAAHTSPDYQCPVWSPDGKRLAVVQRDTKNYLIILSADGKTPPKYLLLDETPSLLSAPVWLPKNAQNPALGADKVMLVYPTEGQSGGLVEIDVDKSQDRQPAVSEVRLPLIGWSDVQDLTLAPDGRYLAGIMLYYNSPAHAIAQLRLFDLQNMGLDILAAAQLTSYEYPLNFTGSLSWLADGMPVWAGAVGLLGPEMTAFQVFDRNPGGNQARMDALGAFDDVAYRAAWSPDGWVVFATESGLWALDTGLAREGKATAVQLSEEQIFDLDWR